VSAAVAAGFMAVFAVAGAIATGLSFSVERVTPWLTVVIGVALVAVGVALLAGWHPSVALPTLNRGGRGRDLRSMFVFGVSYAIASVSCTLPIFISQVSSTFGQSVGTGLTVFVAYALGMAVVLCALSVSVALARQSLVVALKRALPYVNRAAGALLVVTGAYIAWYGLYEIRIGTVAGDDPAIDRVTGWSAELASLVDRIGGVRLGLILALVVALVVAAGYAVSSAKRATSSSSSSP
jgi:cytochrome c biogenesis protein CcdA